MLVMQLFIVKTKNSAILGQKNIYKLLHNKNISLNQTHVFR